MTESSSSKANSKANSNSNSNSNKRSSDGDGSSSAETKKPKVGSSVLTGRPSWDSKPGETTPVFTPLSPRSPVSDHGFGQGERKKEKGEGTEQPSSKGSTAHDSGDEEEEGDGEEITDEQKEIALVALGLLPPQLPDGADD